MRLATARIRANVSSPTASALTPGVFATGDAFCLGGRDIHAVITRAITGDDLEMAAGIYYLLGDRIQPGNVSVAVF